MNIEFRKLEANEYPKTRALWEDIFVEDTKAFLDYYYQIKVAENEIYGAVEDNEIRAMLHLNPYPLSINGTEQNSHYIVAVATDTNYRKKGLMASLLKRSMQSMYDRGEGFTFLMPAAEAIYRPFDFRFVYAQAQMKKKKTVMADQVIPLKARPEDCQELARFATAYLKKRYGIYAIRDEHYYETVLAELQSEKGHMELFREKTDAGKILGCFLSGGEEVLEVREPMVLPKWQNKIGYEFSYSVKKPMIMARILHLETLMRCAKVREDMQCEIGIWDPLLEGNNGTFHIYGKKKAFVSIEKQTEVGETISIAALTSFLFGYQTLERSLAEEHDNLSEKSKEELGKIIPFSPIYLNEIV